MKPQFLFVGKFIIGGVSEVPVKIIASTKKEALDKLAEAMCIGDSSAKFEVNSIEEVTNVRAS